MKALNEDMQMRSDWVLPICTGVSGSKRMAKNPSDPKAGEPPAPSDSVFPQMLEIPYWILFGSGTTGAVAKKLGRNYLGIEQDRDYIEIALTRLKKFQKRQITVFYLLPQKERAAHPFWLARGTGVAGAGNSVVRSAQTPFSKVRADGSIISAKHRGSIHRVGAAIQDAPAC